MNEKIRHFLVLTVYRAIACAGVFLLALILRFFTPHVMEKISIIWTKNTDFGRVAELLSDMMGELIPF